VISNISESSLGCAKGDTLAREITAITAPNPTVLKERDAWWEVILPGLTISRSPSSEDQIKSPIS